MLSKFYPFRGSGRKPRTLYPFLVIPLLAIVLIAGTLTLYLRNFAHAAAADTPVTFAGTVPAAVAHSKLNGPADPNQSITLSIGLRLRNQELLKSYLNSISQPKSLIYHHYLTPAQAQGTFSPSVATHNAVLHYLQASGFTIRHTYKHRMLITFTGTIGQAERVFHVTINNYTAPNGQAFYSNASDPQVPASLVGAIQSFGGLNNAQRWHRGPAARTLSGNGQIGNNVTCVGHGSGYFTPDQIAAAYNLNGIYNRGFHGEGQIVALFELDTFQASDLAAYTSCFGRSHASIQTVVIKGQQPVPSDSGMVEVQLDAELALSTAPSLGTLVIYEAGNDYPDYNAEWAQILQDVPPVVSSSWGLCETDFGQSEVDQENSYFQMAAAQGQSIFIASGDSGSSGCLFDQNHGTQLEPGDPGEQPYVTSVGGTSLSFNGSSYSETTWNNPSNRQPSGASGGGLSLFLPMPSWQSQFNVPGVQNQYSNGKREAPDVALDADPYTGYPIYCTAAAAGCNSSSPWIVVGGTSAASPMWAAMMALVNEESVKAGGFNIGFANPLLYQLASTGSYASDFHDITTGNNDYASLQGGRYPATSRYDMATGLGSFNADALATDLVALARTNNGTRAAPATTTWYFPEGDEGGGFQEYITVENPSPTQIANITITYIFADHTVSVTHSVNPSSRFQFDADQDLHTSPTGPRYNAGAIVTSTIPIVAERPIYFNWSGFASGNDVMGATSAHTSYYFSEADTRQSGQANYRTYIAVINPSATVTANVTVTYYTGSCGGIGQPACQMEQFVVGPMRRQAVSPTDKGLHQKLSIAVTADQNIVTERPLYFTDYIPRAGGMTTGSATVIGATNPGTDWLFAEGYTGVGFQTYYELANFGATTANATVKLEYTNGATQSVAVTVPAFGFTQFDVNALQGNNTTSVSAEITADQPIVAQRLMYFHFSAARIPGGTDIVGEPGPASHTAYAFAEGYTGGQFQEFLTLQNPTNNVETVAITFFTPNVVFQLQAQVLAHSRKTFSINNVLNPINGGEVSMTIQTLGSGTVIVAERPMYFIFSIAGISGASQGGSDVLGYTGS